MQQVEDQARAFDEKSRDALSRLDAGTKAAMQSLRDTLTNVREELAYQKLSREDLADLMAEVSIRLRGAQDPIESS